MLDTRSMIPMLDTSSMIPRISTHDGYSADASQEVSRRSHGTSGLTETSTVRRISHRLDGFQEEMRALVRESLEQQGSMVSEVVQAVRQDMEDTIRVQEKVMQNQYDELSALRERVGGALAKGDCKLCMVLVPKTTVSSRMDRTSKSNLIRIARQSLRAWKRCYLRRR